MPDLTDLKSEQSLPRIFRGYFSYIWLFIGMFLGYLIFSPLVALTGSSSDTITASSIYDGDPLVRLGMVIFGSCLLAAALITLLRQRLTGSTALLFIMLAGFVLRFGTMLYTPFFIHGHDVQTYDSYGHLAYISGLFNMQGLPDSNLGQFYHPPFQHLFGAAVARLYAFLTGIQAPDTIFEAAKLVPCFASCALLIVCSRLFDTFGLSTRAKTVALTVIAFHPTFILLSSSINNDMLMVFFFMVSVLYTIRWYKDPSYKNILLLALSIGCAMSTKFSGSLVAFFTASVFLLTLVRYYKAARLGQLVGQFTAFAAVCFPLGLWYPIRNLKLFGQPLGYVAQLSNDSALYVGDKSFTERFFTFSLPDMLKNIYCDPFTDYSLWEYVVKCALFGEFTFSEKHRLYAVALLLSSIVLIVVSLSSMAYFLFVKKNTNRLAVLSFSALWLLLMLSFVFFNIKYPFGCTMDFRYIVPTVIIGAAFLGLLADQLKEKRHKKLLSALLFAALVIFCISSSGFYII